MAAALHLLSRLAYDVAEALIDPFMNAIFIFEPDEIGRGIAQRLQEVLIFVRTGPLLAGLLPAQEAESSSDIGSIQIS